MGSRDGGTRGSASSRPLSSQSEMSGPTWWVEPNPDFPLQFKSDFSSRNPLRNYDTTKFTWPKCAHGYECAVQMFCYGTDGGRRFFRCPMGSRYDDPATCGMTMWVDPPPIEPYSSYISYLESRILYLEENLSALAPTEQDELVISITDDDYCLDHHCKCPHHKKGQATYAPSTSNQGGRRI